MHAVAYPGGFPASDQVVMDQAEFAELEQRGSDVPFHLVFDVSGVAASAANRLQNTDSFDIGHAGKQLGKAIGILGDLVVVVIPKVFTAFFVGLVAGRVAGAAADLFIVTIDLPRPLSGGSEVYFALEIGHSLGPSF